ncbi:MAG TPA: TrkA family potassium uptake protein [Chloroflexota bacterium]|jgi:trk system potassium uptake protein TrkA|nr:TrkA family potassium uptake protein [Chloroflexota bacterium]
MFAIVGGGGKVGYYLAKELIEQGHEVLIIEQDGRRADTISNELGNVVMVGDGCEARTLAEAGTERADIMLAMTGDDEDNLVMCQVAKKRFGVARTIARINNPKNQEIFRLLGIDATVSATDVVLSVIEQEIPRDTLIPLLRLRYADVELVEADIAPDSSLVGKELRSLDLPGESTIAIVIRHGQPIFPTGSTVLEGGDQVLALTRSAHEEDLRRMFYAEAR